ncbi:MAG: hypothetical protein ACR2HH_00865 [Chthoniobacterales bacterium]
MHRFAFIVFMAGWLFAAAACNGPGSQIIGKWKVLGDSSDVVWDFARDGSVSIGDTTGRYSFGDGGRIKIQTTRATFVHQLEFVGDRMIWKEPDGSKTELTRVK